MKVINAAFPSKLNSISQSGKKQTDSNGYGAYLKMSSNKYNVICTKYFKTSPASGKKTCSLNNDWDDAVRAGVASIIRSSGLSNSNTDAIGTNYLKTELTISYFLDKKIGKHASSDIYDGSINKTWYKKAVKKYDEVKKIEKNISVSIGGISKTEDANNFYLSAKVGCSYCDGYTATTNIKGVSVTIGKNGLISATVPKTKLSSGNNKIVFDVNAYNKEYIARNYSCGANYQTVTPTYTESVNVATAKVSKSIDIDISLTGGLKIIKTSVGGDKLSTLDPSGQTYFKLYSDDECMNVVEDCNNETGCATTQTDEGSILEFKDLTPGTYYLQETKAREGYHTPEKGEEYYCKKIEVTSGINELNITNQTVCEFKFRSDMSMKERIDLYNLIKTDYNQDFRALLNMANIEAEDACATIDDTKNYTKGCFTTNTSTNSTQFSDTNVSMFTDDYGKYTFCLTRFNLANNLGKTNFGNIKSGQAIISTNDTVATATLNRVCYNFGDTNITAPEYNNLNYSNYIVDDVSINGTKLIRNETASGPVDNRTITVTYTLPIMNASNKDGKIYYGEGSCPKGEYCKVLGRGIISQFNLEPKAHKLGFDIKLNETKFGILNDSSDCEYAVDNELIDYKNKIKIEFRPVNTNSDALFLGKNGTANRKIGKNWAILTKEERTEILNGRNNSYNKDKEKQPLYKITLTPDTIRNIRNYNKGKSYDDYNMICVEDGTICISNYLSDLQSSGALQIKSRKELDKFKTN